MITIFRIWVQFLATGMPLSGLWNVELSLTAINGMSH
jgi:hypothetical protein